MFLHKSRFLSCLSPQYPSLHCRILTLVPACLESTDTKSPLDHRGPSEVVLGILRMQKGPGDQGNSGTKGTTSHRVVSPHPRHALELCLVPDTPFCPQVSPNKDFQAWELCSSGNSVNTKDLLSAVFPDLTKLT